jgi:hypothetical protein
MTAETLGQFLAALVAPSKERDQAQVSELAQQTLVVSGNSVEVAFVDQGHTADKPAAAAEVHGMCLEVVELPIAKRGPVPGRGSVLLARRWGVEWCMAWMACFRRAVRDHERTAETFARQHSVAFAMLMALRSVTMAQSV